MDGPPANEDPVAPAALLLRDVERLRRYIPSSRESLRQLQACRFFPDEAAARVRLEADLPVLCAALFRSPYYREVLQAHGLSPNDLRRLEDVALFPVLDRPTLGLRWEDVPAPDLDVPGHDEPIVIRSSGTTGEPIRILRDGYESVHMWTVLRYWCDVSGVELPERPVVVLLCALPGGLEYSAQLPTLDDGMLHRISTVRPDPLRRLLDADPDVLFSDPAGLHWLLGCDELPRPRVVLTSAQYFSPAQRERLRERIPAPVINYYSTSETGPIAWECPGGSGLFHVLSPEVWVETPADEVLVTRLRPSVLPLLRYRTGDTGRVGFGACACGFGGWSINGFRGRRECCFLRPGGGTVDAWQLAWLFKHYPLRDFRLEQVGPKWFRLEVVGDPGLGDVLGDLVQKLDRALVRLGWDGVEIDARIVPELPDRGLKPEPFLGPGGGQ